MDPLQQQIAEQLGLDVRGLPTDPQELRKQDASTWAHIQAEALKRGEFDRVDWPYVIEKIEQLGRMNRAMWKSHCEGVLRHMLMIQHTRPPSRGFWARERKIRKARDAMSTAVDCHPGMAGPVMHEMLADAWRVGKKRAVLDLTFHELHYDYLEGQLVEPLSEHCEHYLEDLIPDECPWSLVEVAGCNPRVEESSSESCWEVWPAAVAERLNQELNRDYPTHGWVEGDSENPIVPRDGL